MLSICSLVSCKMSLEEIRVFLESSGEVNFEAQDREEL
jgi:hypothetical protein